MSKVSFERIIAMQARIVVTKEQKKDFENFLRFWHIHKSEYQKRIRTVYDKLYYNIFSVDNEFTYSCAIPRYSLTCLAYDVEGFDDYMKSARRESDMKITKKDVVPSIQKFFPVIEKTWNQIIEERIPCYLINNWTDIGILMNIEKDSVLKFYGSSNKSCRFYRDCKPIDSAIVIVEEKKPTIKYRPFKTFEEVIEAIKVHGQWIENKNKDYYLFIHHLNFQNNSVQMMEFFKGYKFLDDSPFGVLEEVK